MPLPESITNCRETLTRYGKKMMDSHWLPNTPSKTGGGSCTTRLTASISYIRYLSCQTENSHPTRPSAGCGCYCSGPPSPCPYEGTHLRKRSNLSEHGANRAAIFMAPNALRSYHAIGQTLLSQSPPLLALPVRCHPTQYKERFPR